MKSYAGRTEAALDNSAAGPGRWHSSPYSYGPGPGVSSAVPDQDLHAFGTGCDGGYDGWVSQKQARCAASIVGSCFSWYLS